MFMSQTKHLESLNSLTRIVAGEGQSCNLSPGPSDSKIRTTELGKEIATTQ